MLASKPDRDYLFGDSLHYAAIAKTLSQADDWLSLRLGDEPYFRKPPGLFWVAATVFRTLGASTATARLVGAAAGLGLLALLLVLARRILGPQRGFLAAFVLGTTAMFAKFSSGMRLDVPLTLCIVGSLLAVQASRRHPWCAPLFWAGVALGVLIKGPAGLFPVPILVLWTLLARTLRPWNEPRFWLGLPLLPALLLPWWLHNSALFGERFVQTYVHDDLMGTLLTQEGRNGRIKYAVDLAAEYWPWLPFCLHGAWLSLRARWRGDRSDGCTLPLAWTVAIFALLACVPTHRQRYMVPAFPAMAMLSACSLLHLWPRLVGQTFYRRVAALLLFCHGLLLFSPIDIHGVRTPDVVRFEPIVQALVGGRLWVLGDELPRLLHSGAIFYTDLELEHVPADDLARRLGEAGSGLLVMRPDRQQLPAGVVGRRLVAGTRYDLLRVRAGPPGEG